MQALVEDEDEGAATPQRVRRIGKVVLTASGGTDMIAGIRATAALRPRPDVIIVITDGFTPWPGAASPGTAVVVVVLGAHVPLPHGRGISSVLVIEM